MAATIPAQQPQGFSQQPKTATTKPESKPSPASPRNTSGAANAAGTPAAATAAPTPQATAAEPAPIYAVTSSAAKHAHGVGSGTGKAAASTVKAEASLEKAGASTAAVAKQAVAAPAVASPPISAAAKSVPDVGKDKPLQSDLAAVGHHQQTAPAAVRAADNAMQDSTGQAKPSDPAEAKGVSASPEGQQVSPTSHQHVHIFMDFMLLLALTLLCKPVYVTSPVVRIMACKHWPAFCDRKALKGADYH